MSGPKSGRATVEARRNRLIELLSEGKTETEAGEALREEGFPASHDSIGRDINGLLPALRQQNQDDMIAYASNQYIELQTLKMACHNGSIKPDRAIELLLSIMDREMRLLGTAAPTRTESKSVTLNVDAVDPATLPEYRRWLHATRFMDKAAKEKMFQLIEQSGLNVRQIEAVSVPTESPLWNKEQ